MTLGTETPGARSAGARLAAMKITIASLSGLIASTASAIPVTSFEQGPSGWESVGDVSLQSAAFGVTPTDGLWQALITTLCDSTVVSWCETSLVEKPYSGTSSLPSVTPIDGAPSSAAEFLGLPSDRDAFRGSFAQQPSPVLGESGALRTSFFAAAGDLVAFDWNFLSEGPDGDGAYFSLWSDSFRHSAVLRDPNFGPFQGNQNFQPSTVDLCSRQVGAANCNLFPTLQTGYVTQFLQIEQDGWYSLGFALLETQEGTVPSALAIDNVRVMRVPEPGAGTLALMSLCFGLLLRFRFAPVPRFTLTRDQAR